MNEYNFDKAVDSIRRIKMTEEERQVIRLKLHRLTNKTGIKTGEVSLKSDLREWFGHNSMALFACSLLLIVAVVASSLGASQVPPSISSVKSSEVPPMPTIRKTNLIYPAAQAEFLSASSTANTTATTTPRP